MDRFDNNSRSTNENPVFNGYIASAEESQSPTGKNIIKELRIQRNRQKKYTDQAEWLELSHGDT
jgi:hypothetical protein